MGISDRANFQAVNTMFEKLVDLYLKTEPGYDFGCYARTVAIEGTRLELPFLSNIPAMRDWIENKIYDAMRANVIGADVVAKSKATKVAIADIQGDRIGLIQEQLAAMLSSVAKDREQVAFDKLVAGFSDPGHDGVSFFNASHPNGPSGGTQSNTTTSALGESTFNAACAAMMSLRDESGTPLGIRPRVLLVGPTNRRMAEQLTTGDSRLIAVDNAGLESGTRVAAAAPSNVMKNWGIVPVVCDRLVGTYDDYWFLFDDSNPMLRAVVLGEQGGGPVGKNNLAEFDDQPEKKFSVDYHVAPCFGHWAVAYGANVS